MATMHLVIPIAMFFAANAALAQDQVNTKTATSSPFPSFTYAAELGLIYVDRLTSPSISNPYRNTIMQASPLASSSSKEGTRTLGLHYFKLMTRWELPHESALVATFRPDASVRDSKDGQAPREVDTRSGQPYRSLPELKLLDAYHLELNPGADATLKVGVFRDVTPWVTAYAPTLDFGLRVLFPEKFFGARLDWRLQEQSLPLAGGSFNPATKLSLLVYEGPDDRVETLSPSQQSYDTAPASRDPNHGGALIVSHAFGPQTFLLGMVGFDEKRVDDAKLANIYGSIAGSWGTTIGQLPVKIAADGRYSRDAWRNAPVKRSSLVQESASLTGSLQFSERQWLAAGFHYGISERHQALDSSQKIVVRGYQTDLGYLFAVTPATDLSVFLSDEQRMNDANGIKSDGFVGPNRSRRKINRIGIEINQSFNGT